MVVRYVPFLANGLNYRASYKLDLISVIQCYQKNIFDHHFKDKVCELSIDWIM